LLARRSPRVSRSGPRRLCPRNHTAPIPQPAKPLPLPIDELHEGTPRPAVLQEEDLAGGVDQPCAERAASKRQPIPLELDLQTYGRGAVSAAIRCEIDARRRLGGERLWQ